MKRVKTASHRRCVERAHAADRSRRQTGANNWFRCPDCGKRSYHSRRDARSILRVLRTQDDDGHMRVYQCGDGYHIGHVYGGAVS